MTRPVEELKRESERSRQALAATTDRLRDQLSHTADDLRQMVSPQHIKSEVSDYITDKTQGWLDALKRQAMENPMQAVAVGTAAAIPFLKLVRAFPLPLLMMGAGLALNSRSLRTQASRAAAPAMGRAGEVFDQARSVAGSVSDTVASAQTSVAQSFENAGKRASDLGSDLSWRAAGARRMMTDRVNDGVDVARATVGGLQEAVSSTVEGARNYAAAVPEKARELVGDNAALIGGLGIAMGAILAAALPSTEAEGKALAGASKGVKQSAEKAARASFDAVQDTARSAADAAQQSVANANLDMHATRMTQNIADVVKDAAEDVVSAAFNPSRPPNS
jgi:hypothetical protein